jgi:hypothetical protein
MATVAIGLPVFAMNAEDDLERFIELYKGYLHSIGIDPSADGGPPAGWEKAMGILHACLVGPAATWYDSNILGKRVKLRNILVHAVHGDEPTFKGMNGNAGANCPVNTWVAGSGAANQMAPGGVGANVPVTNVWPDYALEGNRDIWVNHAGMEFTNDALNHNVPGSGAGAGVVIAGGAGAGHPYVIPTHPCHALIKMRDDLPIQQVARRQLRFGNLFQEHMPVRDFYDKVRRGAELLGYGNDIIVNQFLRGLNEENAIEAERIGPERNIEELVGLLERVETRKAELRRGKERRENIQYQQDRQIIPEQLPPVGQEPVILKPVQKHAVTQEEMGRLLQQQAETFQSQIRQLQEGLKARDSKPKPVKRAVRYEYDPNLEGWKGFPDPGPNPFDDGAEGPHRKYTFDDIMGIPEQKLASRIAKRLRERREDEALNRAMRNLSLNDNVDQNKMDIDAIRGIPIELVQGENGEIMLVQKKR